MFRAYSVLTDFVFIFHSAAYSGVRVYGYWCLELVNRPRDAKGKRF